MIPKNIITIWLGPEMPEVVKKCAKTHDLEGYTHLHITDKNCHHDKYVDECIARKEWVRAVDYLRLYYLNKHGGIYLDMDAEIIRPFDDILGSRMFAFTEESRYINNGYIGSEANHPFLKYLLNTMEHNFRFEQNLFWPGMQFFSEAYYIADRQGLGMEIHDQNNLEFRVKHHALKSWLK